MGLKREDIQAVLQLEPFALLSSDYELVQDALLEGKPVASRSKFRTSMQALSRQLAGEAATQKKPASWLERLYLRRRCAGKLSKNTPGIKRSIGFRSSAPMLLSFQTPRVGQDETS